MTVINQPFPFQLANQNIRQKRFQIIGHKKVKMMKQQVEEQPDVVDAEPEQEQVQFHFRNKKLLDQHYEKHGIEMGFASAEEYEAAASAVIYNPDVLSKKEKEDGDYVFYVEATNEFVVVSTDGFIRTYFLPDSGKAYYDRQ